MYVYLLLGEGVKNKQLFAGMEFLLLYVSEYSVFIKH